MFEGKVALVTGSSQGIGQVIATKFAEYGADVVVHGLGATDDCKTCQDIRAMAAGLPPMMWTSRTSRP